MKSCPEGYYISFPPKKQTNKASPPPETFLVPKVDENNEGDSFDFYSILHKYVESINKEIAPGPNESFWWCGRVLKNGETKFVKQHFGINKMRDVPRFLVRKLGYDKSEVLEFKGHR